MSVIESVSNSTPAVQQGTQANKEMPKDTFLTLMITQMQHQDPLNPMDNNEFTAQLAQFSSLEQLQNVNNNLGYLQLYLASLNNAQAMGFIGKEVVASGNAVSYDGANSPSLHYQLNDNASRVIVNIFDKNGTLVRTVEMGQQDNGKHEVLWDGKDKTGDNVAEGTYSFEVLATDTEGNAVPVNTFISGKVEGITFNEGLTYVIVEGQEIALGDIIEVKSEESDSDETSGQNNTINTVMGTIRDLGGLAIKTAPFFM